MSDKIPIVVSGQGYVFVGGCKIARVQREGGKVVLTFHDKNKRRSRKRGSDQVEIAIQELAKAVENG